MVDHRWTYWTGCVKCHSIRSHTYHADELRYHVRPNHNSVNQAVQSPLFMTVRNVAEDCTNETRKSDKSCNCHDGSSVDSTNVFFPVFPCKGSQTKKSAAIYGYAKKDPFTSELR